MRLTQGKILAVAVAAVVAVSSLFYLLGPSDTPAADRESRGSGAPRGGAGPNAAHGRAKTPTIDPHYAFDITDPRKLVGFSDNVFVATVDEQVGDEPLKTSDPNWSWPRTQYRVTVSETIKSGGERPVGSGDKVVVNQYGGRDKKTGKTYVVATHAEGANESTTNAAGFGAGAGGKPDETGGPMIDAPLTPGKRYLFATRYDAARKTQAISAQPTGTSPSTATRTPTRPMPSTKRQPRTR